MRMILAAALMGLSIGPASAGPRTYVAADCTVFMMMKGGRWRQIDNDCFMGRDHDANVTAVKMGEAMLVIKREPSVRGLARIYTIDSKGNTSEGEPAFAQGPCWVGITLKFCAP